MIVDSIICPIKIEIFMPYAYFEIIKYNKKGAIKFTKIINEIKKLEGKIVVRHPGIIDENKSSDIV